MRVDLGFQRLKLCRFPGLDKLRLFFFCNEGIFKEPKGRADKDRGAAVKNIVEEIKAETGIFRIIPDTEIGWQKPLFCKIPYQYKRTYTEEKSKKGLIDLVGIKKPGNDNKIVDVETGDAGDKEGDIKQSTIGMKHKIRNQHRPGNIDDPEEDMQI